MAELKKVRKGDRYGYVNAEGNLIFDYIFENGVDTFGSDSYRSTPYAAIIKDGSIGIINEEGETIIPAEYDDAFHLFGEFFAVRKVFSAEDVNGHKSYSYKMGVLNKGLETIIPFEFDFISSKGAFFECYTEASCTKGISFTYMGRKYDYHPKGDANIYDSVGFLISKGIIRSADDKYFVIEVNRKVGVCNSKGETIIPQTYSDIKCCGNDRFIAETNDGKDWSFSILDCNNNQIADKDYKYIKSHNGVFFECYLSAERDRDFSNSIQYTGRGAAVWINSDGKELHTGDAEVMSMTYLRAKKANKWGVIDNFGNRTLNFQYDAIRLDGDHFIVEYNEGLGILGKNSELIVNPVYKQIEFVNIGDYTELGKNPNYGSDDEKHTTQYGAYSANMQYDTANQYDRLARHIISSRMWGINKVIDLPFQNYDYSNTLILRTDTYEELFSITDGLITNGRFDHIHQITNLSYVVQKDGKFGVFRIDTKELILPCEYDRIIFSGGQTVLLQKNEKWGAKTLVLPTNVFYSLWNVDIDCKFDEIFYCSPVGLYYCVKNVVENHDGVTHDAYFIVDKFGKEPKSMESMPGYHSRIEYYGDDRLLTSLNGKYGFISTNGYTSIPFKYDEVIHLEGQKFAVRVGKRWGAIDETGREYVQVKYDGPINNRDEKFIMMDVESGCYGIINPSGYELVPCLYEHIIPKDSYTFVGFGGYDTFPDDDGNGNFFSTINHATWGCINEKGQLIVPIKYDCLEIRDGYIIAGRDGGMLHHDDSSYGSDYSGVYDLYNNEGTMLFGGFRKVVIDNEKGVFKAFFGGKWEYREIYHDEWNNIRVEDYSFDEGNGRWIAVTTDFKPIPEPEDHPGFTYKVGFVGTMKERVEGNKRITTTNLPLKSLLKSKPIITNGYAIINRADKFQLVRLADRLISEEYDNIVRVDDGIAIVRKEDKVGIIKSNFESILPLEYLAITKPVDDICFCIKCKEDKLCDAYLVDFHDGVSEPIKVIEDMEAGIMCYNIASGGLRIESIDTKDQRLFKICDPSIFNENIHKLSLLSSHSPRESLFSNEYWVSSEDVRLLYNEWTRKQNDNDDTNDDRDLDYDDDRDYMRDTWDAMTDGMYGDMPEGFDGDFDFLG